jgi:hypothetical protein
MTGNPATSDVRVRGSTVAVAPAPLQPETSAAARAGRMLLWVGLIVAGLVTLASVVRFAAIQIGDSSLAEADQATITAKLAEDWPAQRSADYFETLSELALQLPVPDMEKALLAARRTVEADPSRAYAWATIAYLEAGQAKAATPASIEALDKSMDACPLCSVELVRWRFNFVLSYWGAVPEATRRRAFEHADMLRWTDGNGEFLGEMKIKAERAGLPFDAYRSAVDTPVRGWDIEPAKAATK